MLGSEGHGALVVRPRLGEMVLMEGNAGCITRIIGVIDGRWWVETSVAACGVVQEILHEGERGRMWAVRLPAN